jgi:hypothetical protein
MDIVDCQVHVWPAERPDRMFLRDGQGRESAPYTCEQLLADMEHAGLLAPALEQAEVLAGRERKAAHDGEAAGTALRLRQRIVVAVAFDRRRHQHGTLDAGAFHVGQQ